MKTSTKLLLSALTFLGVFFIPELLSVGATSRLDSSSALASGSTWTVAAVIFGGGILTALTPCVFPLIPITVAIFSGGRNVQRSRGKSALLTGCYVLGMATTFVVLGDVAALSGKAFGTALQSPVVNLILAAFFVALAFSMFGAFELALPSALNQRLNQVGGAGFGGAYSMGLVAGLVAAPCTGPVLLGILTYVAAHKDVVLGSLLLFLYALGIGVPFFVIGVFSFNLGKSGPWMDAVKSVIGIMLLAMAIGYVRLSAPGFSLPLPSGTVAVYVVATLAGLGVLLGAIHLSFHGSRGEQFLKAAGLTLVLLGITARLDVESIALAECTPGADGSAGICWLHDLDKALADAKAAHRPAFVDFYADWCAACKELDRKTYPDARVREEAKRFVAVKIDGTHESDALDKIYDLYKVEGLPTVIFIDSQGRLQADPRVVGFVTPQEMIGLLKKVN